MAEPAAEERADEFQLRNNSAAGRWEVTDGDRVIAFAAYRLRSGAIAFTHTVVEPQYEGRGIGSRLARAALDDAVARELRIVPYCPFIRAYVQRHSEYAQSVDMP